jgi:steroid Delta-isomerase
MPTQSEMKAAVQAYIDRFNAKDADGIMDLFADNAVIEDPVGSPLKSCSEFADFVRQGVEFGASLSLSAPIRSSHANYAAMVFTVTFMQNGRRVTTNSADVMEFDEAGKILSMKGFWGPEDVIVG